MNQDENYFRQLIDQMDRTYVPTWSWANVEVGDRRNVVMFSTGLGDGIYSSYFGYDERGNPVCLVTDFWVFFVPPDEEQPDGKKWWQFWK